MNRIYLQYRRLEEDKDEYSGMVKPPNVVIYADSPDTIDNVHTVLEKVLDTDKYVTYIFFINLEKTI